MPGPEGEMPVRDDRSVGCGFLLWLLNIGVWGNIGVCGEHRCVCGQGGARRDRAWDELERPSKRGSICDLKKGIIITDQGPRLG